MGTLDYKYLVNNFANYKSWKNIEASLHDCCRLGFSGKIKLVTDLKV